ncbi:MAG: P-loop NTPase [Candidatus Aenigmarchaeota archaeon]|nr:P-loop NTPase [Candidatus Aenigmarchaeota archaeon]
MRNVIGILSGKGGVGKTTVAVNLALLMHKLGEEVIAVDGNLKNPNFSLHLGIFEHDLTIHDVLSTEISILEALHIHPSGLRFVPASLSLGYLGLDIDSSKLKGLFKDISGTILIDSPPGLSKEVFSILETCDQVLIVTNPHLPDITDCLKLIEIAKDLDKEILGIVLNKVRGKSYEVSKEEVENISNTRVVACIPWDENIIKSLAQKTPVVEFKPFSKASIALQRFSHELIGKEYKSPRFLKIRRIFS